LLGKTTWLRLQLSIGTFLDYGLSISVILSLNTHETILFPPVVRNIGCSVNLMCLVCGVSVVWVWCGCGMGVELLLILILASFFETYHIATERNYEVTLYIYPEGGIMDHKHPLLL